MATKTGKAAGGEARARVLSPERRKEIAMAGVQARKDRANLLVVTHTGMLKLGDVELPCYVTTGEDGKPLRLLSQRALQDALRLVDEEVPVSGQHPGSRVDRFLTAKWSKPLIFKNKEPDHFAPVKCVYEGKTISGYRAEVLADVCDAMMEARELGLLTTPRRIAIAEQCMVLMRGFMRVGITALVDEATGYQRDRARDELARILEQFIAKDMQAYAKKFPPEFYEEIFRLRQVPYEPGSVKRPAYFGHLTNDIIYRRLAPGVWTELKAKAKKESEKGVAKPHLHRFLSADVGDPRLRTLITKVVTIMQLSDSWADFKQKLDNLVPAQHQEPETALETTDDDGTGL